MFFNRYDKDSLPDFSSTLGGEDAWNVNTIKRLGISGNITVLGVEPFSGLLAIGTDRGSVHLFGSLSVSVELSIPGAPYRKIRFISFAQSIGKLVIIGNVLLCITHQVQTRSLRIKILRITSMFTISKTILEIQSWYTLIKYQSQSSQYL